MITLIVLMMSAYAVTPMQLTQIEKFKDCIHMKRVWIKKKDEWESKVSGVTVVTVTSDEKLLAECVHEKFKKTIALNEVSND